MEDDDLRELAQDLWRRHKGVLTFLMDKAPDAAGGFAQYVIDNLDRLTKQASSELIKLVLDRKIPSYINMGIEDWDSLPGLKSGKGWTPSGRIPMLEINIRAKYIDIKFLVGPGPENIRNALIEEISTQTKQKLGDSKKWTQVTKVRLKRNVEELQENEFADCFDEVTLVMKNFIKKSIEPLDPAIRRAVKNLNDTSNL